MVLCKVRWVRGTSILRRELADVLAANPKGSRIG
jgi:hypothetical protein